MTGPEHGPSGYGSYKCGVCQKVRIVSCVLNAEDGEQDCCSCDAPRREDDDEQREAQEERQRVVVDALVSRIRDLESQIKALKQKIGGCRQN